MICSIDACYNDDMFHSLFFNFAGLERVMGWWCILAFIIFYYIISYYDFMAPDEQ